MTSKAAKDLVLGYLQSEAVESTARYVNRGRAYKNLTDTAVQEAWVEAFRAWAVDYAESALLDDLASELVLRKLGIPYDLIAKDLIEVQRRVAQMGPFSDEAEKELSDKMSAYAKAKAKASN